MNGHRTPTPGYPRSVTADAVYHRLVMAAGLYGQAYFGWTHTPAQARKLNELWRAARLVADAS